MDVSQEQKHLIQSAEKLLERIEADEKINHGNVTDIVSDMAQFILEVDEELDPRFANAWKELHTILIPGELYDTLSRKSPRVRYGFDDRGDLMEYLNDVVEVRSPAEIPEIDISDSDRVVFHLGAGASYASDIPTVQGLLDVLLDQARRTRREDLEPVIQYCDTHEDLDIEDLLTAAYISDFAVSDTHVTSLVNYFLFSEEDNPPEETAPADPTSVNFIQNTLRTLFGSITSTMIPKDPNPTHEAIREFIQKHDNTTITTTNYDYCMDQELLDNSVGLKNTIGSDDMDEYDESVSLLKMHGSINWWFCESCQLVSNIPPSEVKGSLGGNSADYAVIGICPDCHGQRRPLLVPPINFKFLIFPALIQIWNKAREKISKADYIITVGYSFSDSDDYIYNLFSKSMKRNDDTTLININTDREVTKTLRDVFEAELGDFDSENRIEGIHGPSEETMPKFIDKLIESDDSSVDGDTSPEKSAADD